MMQEIKLVTIDVWDTLIRRSCHPDEVKLHVCRFLLLLHFWHLKPAYRDMFALLRARQESEGEIGVQKKSLGFDDEYNLLEVYRLWIAKTFQHAEAAECISWQLREVELAQEFLVTYRDPYIVDYLNKYDAVEKVFVSDFYMPAEDILAILKKNALTEIVKRGYSSSDINLNKRSGRLFTHVLEYEEVRPDNVLHIGDNVHSDVRVPSSHGITAMHYLPMAQHQLRKEREGQFGQFSRVIHDTLASLVADCPNQENVRANAMYLAGIEYSTLVVGFVLYVMEQAITSGHDKVFFFTREGEFFQQVYDALAAQDPFGIPVPKSELLEVSRIATFSASLQDVSLQSLMRLWSLYSTQSLGALFSSLNVDGAQFSVHLKKYGLNLIDDIRYPWLDARMHGLFNDTDFTSKLAKELNAKRETLKGYLAEKKFPTVGKAAIVDIGWRGTIQDNLAHLLPNVCIDGFYLGLDKFLNQQPVNVRKFALGPNLNDAESENAHLFAKVSPIEMLCNSPNGSVVGYVNVGGNYLANRLVVESENTSFHNSVYYFQQGVIIAAKALGEKIRRHVIPVQALRELAIKKWLDICLNPPVVIADAYFNLSHNESFGLGRFEDKTAVIPTAVWVKAFFSLSGFRNLVSRLEKTGWPEGYLAKRGVGWFWQFVQISRDFKKKLEGYIKRSC